MDSPTPTSPNRLTRELQHSNDLQFPGLPPLDLASQTCELEPVRPIFPPLTRSFSSVAVLTETQLKRVTSHRQKRSKFLMLPTKSGHPLSRNSKKNNSTTNVLLSTIKSTPLVTIIPMKLQVYKQPVSFRSTTPAMEIGRMELQCQQQNLLVLPVLRPKTE